MHIFQLNFVLINVSCMVMLRMVTCSTDPTTLPTGHSTSIDWGGKFLVSFQHLKLIFVEPWKANTYEGYDLGKARAKPTVVTPKWSANPHRSLALFLDIFDLNFWALLEYFGPFSPSNIISTIIVIIGTWYFNTPLRVVFCFTGLVEDHTFPLYFFVIDSHLPIWELHIETPLRLAALGENISG